MRFGIVSSPAGLALGLSLALAITTGTASAQDYFPSGDEGAPVPIRPSVPGRRVSNRSVEDVSPFRAGPFLIRPHASYRYDYGDGVRPRPGITEKTSLHRFALGSAFELGDMWDLDYTATWSEYSSEEFRETLDHNASLSGLLEILNWQVSFEQSFSKSAPALIETGGQTGLEIHTTEIGFARSLTDQLSAHVNLLQDLRYSDSLSDVFEWSVTPGITYAWTSYFFTNANLSVGHVVVTSAPDIVYYRPQVGATVVLTDKVSFDAFVGVDRREFMVGSTDDMDTPMFGASVQYAPLEHTLIEVEMSRQTSTSYLAGLTTESEQWSVDLRQRLFGWLMLTAAYSENNADYTAPVMGFPIIRKDERHTLQIGLQTAVFKRGSVSVTYRETKNDSSIGGYAIDSSTIGFQIGWRY